MKRPGEQAKSMDIMNNHALVKKDNILLLFSDKLKEQLGYHLKQIILFGSKARGDDAPDSDYDCLAIVDSLSPVINETIDEIAGEFLYQYNVVFSVFPVSEKRYHTQVHNPFFINVQNEGILL